MKLLMISILALTLLSVSASAQQSASPASSPAGSQETIGPDVFREKFDAPSTLWPQTDNVFVEKGKLTVKGDCAISIGSYVYEDFEATVVASLFTSVVHTKGSTSSASDLTTLPTIGLSFRVSKDGYYTALLSPLAGQNEGLYRLFKVVNGKQIELTRWRPDLAIKMRNELTVRCVGQKIELHVNAIKIAEFKDDSHARGRLTLVFSGGLGSFDDVVIKKVKK